MAGVRAGLAGAGDVAEGDGRARGEDMERRAVPGSDPGGGVAEASGGEGEGPLAEAHATHPPEFPSGVRSEGGGGSGDASREAGEGVSTAGAGGPGSGGAPQGLLREDRDHHGPRAGRPAGREGGGRVRGAIAGGRGLQVVEGSACGVGEALLPVA